MKDLTSPPEYIRDLFRQHLIREGSLFDASQAEELKRFKFYLETLEAFISREEASEITALETDSAHLSGEAKEEFMAWYYPVHWDDIFRTHLRSSFLISLVSLLEGYLTDVCRDAAIIARTPITVRDLKDPLFVKSRLFLERFVDFKRPTEDQWVKLSRIYEIRNLFVHRNGSLTGYNHEERVRRFMQAEGNVVETNGVLTLKAEFCPAALDLARMLSEALAAELSALRTRVQEAEKARAARP